MVNSKFYKFVAVMVSFVMCFAMIPSVAFAAIATYDNAIITNEGELIFFQDTQSYTDGTSYNQMVKDVNGRQYTGKVVTGKFNEFMRATTDTTSSWMGQGPIEEPKQYGMLDGASADAEKVVKISVASGNTPVFKSLYSLFYGFENLKTVDLTGADLSKVDRMAYAFNNCTKLESVKISANTSSKLNTMSYMFNNCPALTAVDLTISNASGVMDMDHMFDGCTSLTSLDLSKVGETSNLRSAEGIFSGCTNLETLNIKNLNTLNKISTAQFPETNFNDFFKNCKKLVNITFSNSDIFSTTNGKGGYIEFPYGFWTNKNAGSSYSYNTMSNGSYNTTLRDTYTRVNDVETGFTYPDIETGLTYTGEDFSNYIREAIANETTYASSVLSTKKSDTWQWSQDYYDISLEGDFINANKAAVVTVTGKEYLTGSKTFTVNINPEDLNKVEVEAIPDQSYTGQQVKPELKLSYNGLNLVENTDYTVEYANNTNQTNSARIVATAVDGGNFKTGTKKTATFKILRIDGEITKSDKISYKKKNSDNSYIVWEVSGNDLYIDNFQILGDIKGVSINNYDSDGELVKSSTAKFIPSNIEVIVTNDGEGRPYMFSGEGMQWEVKTKEADGYSVVTKIAESGSTLEINSENDDSQTISGDSIIVNETLDSNEVGTSVERIYQNYNSKQIQIYRSSALESTINKDGTVDVNNWARKISEDIDDNKITSLKIESFKHGNKKFTSLMKGDNIIFSEDSATASGIARLEETNDQNTTRTLNNSNNGISISGIFDDTMNVSGVLSTTSFDDDGNEVEVYRSDETMKANVLYNGVINDVKFVGSNEEVNKCEHEMDITLDKESYVYTGGEIKPVVEVKIDGSDDALNKSLYTVSYEHNINCNDGATVKVTYTFDGNTIEASKEFSIVKADNKDLEASSETVNLTYKKETGDISPITVTGSKGDISYEAESNENFGIDEEGKLTVTGDPNAGDYTLKVTVKDSGNDNYNESSVEETISIKVEKAENSTLEATANENVELVYGDYEDVDINLFTTSGNIGTVYYEKTSSTNNYFSIDSNTGKLTIEGTPDVGTYSMKVDVIDGGDDNYKSKTISKDVVIKVVEAENTTFEATANAITFKYGSTSVSTKPITCEGNYGDITYSKVSGSSYFDIDQNGYLKIVGTPSTGEYTVNFSATDSGGLNHKSKTINNDVKITVEKASSPYNPGVPVTPTTPSFNTTANNVELIYGEAITTPKKIINATNNYGTVSYVKQSGDDSFDIDSNGCLVVNGVPEVGTYSITIISTDSGDNNHSSKSVTNTVRISILKASNKNLNVVDNKISIDYGTAGETTILPVSVTGNIGAPYYKKASGTNYFDVTSFGNVVVVGTPTIGSYSFDLTVTDIGNSNYAETSKTIPVTINVVKAENKSFKTIINEPTYVYNNYDISHKVIEVEGNLGDVTYEKVSGSTNFTIDEDGYMQVVGVPVVGTYQITVNATDSGDVYHNPKTIADNINVVVVKAENTLYKMTPVTTSVAYKSKTSNNAIVKTSGNLGKITYGKISGNKNFDIDKNGKLVVNGSPAVGTYRIDVYATDNGDNNYAQKRIAGTVVINVVAVSNTMTVKANTVKLTKSTKAQKIAKKKAFTIKNSVGKVTFKKVAKGSSNKLTITKSGVVKVKAKAKGTLKLKVKITAAGNNNYKAKTVTRTMKVKIS